MAGRVSQFRVQVTYANPNQAVRVSQLRPQVAYANPAAKGRVSQFLVQAYWPTTLPRITSLTPANGLVGATVTITGANFGASQGTGSVTVGGTAATASAWSDTEITCTVPSRAAGACAVVVTTGGSLASAAVAFTVDAPPAMSRSFVVIVG